MSDTNRRVHKKRCEGLTLVELLIATLIMVPVCMSVMYVFLQCMAYNDLSRNSSLAVRVCQDKITQIENTTFDQMAATYNNSTFTDSGLTGRGAVYINSSTATLCKITVSFSWREKSGRIIGEDTNLNGVIDAGEDKNANGILDSPVLMTTYRYDV